MADNNDKNKRQFFASAYYNSGEIGSDMTYDDFINAIKSNPNLIRKVYAGLEKAKSEGKIKELAPISVIENGFGVTSTPSPTTKTQVATEEVPGSGGGFPTMDELNTPISNQPLPNVGTPANQPIATTTETQIAPLDQQAGQVQGGRPLTGEYTDEAMSGLPLHLRQQQPPITGDVLANAPKQYFQWSGQAPVQPQVNPVQQNMNTMTPEQGAQDISQEGTPLLPQEAYDRPLNYTGKFIGTILRDIPKFTFGEPIKGVAQINRFVFGNLGIPQPSTIEEDWMYQAGQTINDAADYAMTQGAQTRELPSQYYKKGVYAFSKEETQDALVPQVATAFAQIIPMAFSIGASKAPQVVNYLSKGSKYISPAMLTIMNAASRVFDKPAVISTLQVVSQLGDDAAKAWDDASNKTKEQYVSERVLNEGATRSEAEETYDLLKGKTRDEVVESTFPLAITLGQMEKLPLEAMFKWIPENTYSRFANMGLTGGVGYMTERLQESAQTGVENIAVSQLYDKTRSTMAGVDDAGKVGGTAGFFMGLVIGGLKKRRAKIKQQVESGEITQEEAVKEAEEVNKTEAFVNDKVDTFESSTAMNIPAVKEMRESKEAETFFDKNEASLTNPISTMPTQVETIFDKITNGLLISPESLHEAYQWTNNAVKETLANQALTPAEKGATLNILNGMLSEIDKANTEGQKFVDEVEAVSVQDRVPAVREGVKPLPTGQSPKGSVTPSISQAKTIREENKKKQAGMNVLPSSGQTIITPEAQAENNAKPTPNKIKVLGKDMNMFTNYIPSKAEDIDLDAIYTFTADSKDGIPAGLRDVASINTSEVNGVKKESWSASISGDELTKQYPNPTENVSLIDKGNKSEVVEAQAEMVTENPAITEQPTKTLTPTQNESETKTNQEKPLLEGVRDGGTETQTGQESTQLRAEEAGKEVSPVKTVYNNDGNPTEIGGYKVIEESESVGDERVFKVVDENGNERYLTADGKELLLAQQKGTSVATDTKTEPKTETKETTQPTLTPVNATDVETITKIENAPEKGRELALAKPTNKGLKRAFEAFQDLSDRARKAGIYDGKTLKIGGQEITLDTPAKFKAFLANQGNYNALNEAVKDVQTTKSVAQNIMGQFETMQNDAETSNTEIDKASDSDVILKSGVSLKPILAGMRAGMKVLGYGDKAIAKYTAKIEDWTAKAMRKGMKNQNKFVAKASNIAQGFIRNIARTGDEIDTRRKALGNVKLSPLTALDFYNNAVAIVNNNPQALQRVHQVLDPEAYEGAVTVNGLPRVELADLNPEERRLYDILRNTLDFIHQWHFDNGFIKQETYDKYKGTYSPRMWEDADYLDAGSDLAVMFQQMGKSLDKSYIKKRKEIDDIPNDIIEDPVYGTALRMAQTLRNQAIIDYATQISTSNAVWNGQGNPPPGYVLLEGPKYGPLNGKYVARDVAEDFKGYYMTEGMTNEMYRLIRWYDNTDVRQFIKQGKTVFNPITILGNMLSSFSFGFTAGVDPMNMLSNSKKAFDAVKNKNDDYKFLISEGVLGTDVFTQDIKVKSESVRKPVTPQPKSIKEKIFDKLDVVRDIYGGTDDVAKLSIYYSLLEQGKTKQEAAKIVFNSTQNYNEVGRMYDFASKTPFIGNPYIKFKADLGRLVKNSVTQKPLTTAAYVGALYAFAAMASKLSDEEEEVRKAREARSFIPKVPMPDFMKKVGLGDVPLVWQTKYGEVNAARLFSPMYVYDTGEEGFLGNVAEISSYLPFQARKNNDESSIVSVLPQFNDPVIGPIVNILMDRDFRDKPILDPGKTKYTEGTASGVEQLMNAGNYLGNAWIPFYDKVHGVTKAIQGDEDYYGRVRTLPQALLSMFVKVQDMDKPEVIRSLDKDIRFKISRLEYLQDEQNKKITQDGNLSPSVQKELMEIQSNEKLSPEVKQKKIEEKTDAVKNKYASLENRKAKVWSSIMETRGLYQQIKQ
jgi:hypothetical protein